MQRDAGGVLDDGGIANGIRIGGIMRDVTDVMARAAVRHITVHGALAVTVEPDGAVYVEPEHSADVQDVIGVYAMDDCPFRLQARISADLLFERMNRRAAA